MDYEFNEAKLEAKGLEFESNGIWDPYETYGDEAKEYFPDYIQEQYRESYVFKDYSGYGFYKKDEDPVSDAVDLKERGDTERAYNILTKLLEDYPECIDALVHIGNMYLDPWFMPEHALHCYKTAILIAEKNFPEKFDPVFLWGILENRPYIRALHGLCIAYWRMKKFEESLSVAKKGLRINPPDNTGFRFILEELEKGREWREDF